MGILSRSELYTTLKTGILIFGVMILVIESHAIFESPWNRVIFQNNTGGHLWAHGQINAITEEKTIYYLCNKLKEYANHTKYVEEQYNDKDKGTKTVTRPPLGDRRTLKSCPKAQTGLEYFFYAVLILTYICSCVSLGFSIWAGGNRLFQCGDKYYHFVAGVLLLIGGIVNIISAQSIHDFLTVKSNRYPYQQLERSAGKDGALRLSALYLYDPGVSVDYGQFYKGKITAGVFAIISSAVYIGTGALGLKL